MPTYEYRCRDCGHEFEITQAFTDDPLATCPSCAGSLRKVFGAVGIAFKGSGFYKTDSRGSGSSPSAKPSGSDSGSGSGDAAAASTKTDSGTKSDSSSGGSSSTPSAPSTPAAKPAASTPKASLASTSS